MSLIVRGGKVLHLCAYSRRTNFRRNSSVDCFSFIIALQNIKLIIIGRVKMQVVFEDDMMEFKRWLIVPMVLSCLVIAWPIAAILNKMITTQVLIKMIILGVALLLCSLYLFLYTVKYRVTISDDVLCVRSLFKTQKIELSKGLKCEEKKKLNSKYSLIVVSVDDAKINIRTKNKQS